METERVAALERDEPQTEAAPTEPVKSAGTATVATAVTLVVTVIAAALTL